MMMLITFTTLSNTPFHPILTHYVVNNQIFQADKVQETLTQQGLEEAGLETSSRLDCENNGDSSISADLFVDHHHDDHHHLIIIMMTRFPSVDTLISEVPGTGWMSRSETAK